MYFIFDFLVLVFYTAYKNTTYDSPGLHESQTRLVFGMSICVLGGMFSNYLLADHCGFYRKLLNDYIVLFAVLPIFYMTVVYLLVTKRYTDERIARVVANRENAMSVSSARFLSFLYGVVFVISVMAIFVYTAYAFAK